MANLNVLDGAELSKYLKATGSGSNGDPHVVQNSVTGVDAVDAAPTQNPVVFAGVVSPSAVQSGDVQYVSVDADGRLSVVGTLDVASVGGTVTVAGTVAATQSGTWNVADVSGTVSLPTGASTLAEQQTQTTSLQLLDDAVSTTGSAVPAKGFQVTGTDGTNARAVKVDSSGELQVDVLTLPALPTGSNTIGVVTANAGSGTFVIDVAEYGGSAVGAGNAIHVQPGTSAVFPISDNGGSITVDGTVAATQSGTWNVANVSGTVSLPTGASTLAEQQSQTTALQLIDDPVGATGSGTPAKGFLVGGTDGTNLRGIKVDSSGELQVDVLTLPSLPAGSNAIGSVSATISGTPTVGVSGTVAVTDNSGSLTVDAPVGTPVFVRLSDGSSAISTLPVSLASVPSHAVTNAGTFAVQASQSGTWAITGISGTVALPTGASTLAEQQTQTTSLQLLDDAVATTGSAITTKGYAVSGTDGTNARVLKTDASGELQVDVLTLPALPTGSNTIGTATVVQSTASSLNAQVVGSAAHDASDSGNPVKVGAKAETSPKGVTLVADGDRTDLYADADGILMVKLNTSNADLISERVSNTDGSSTAFTNFSAVASTRNYVTAYSVFRTDSGTTPIYVDFRDGTAGSVLWSVVLPPNSGANLSSPVPLFKTSANTALAFDVSAATSTVYISVSGFQSKV
jgi:hypothetical protein